AVAPRGVRLAADRSAAWFQSEDFWRTYFMSLARDRFDRLELVFERVPEAQVFPLVRTISQIGSQYGVDLALGIESLSDDFTGRLQALLSQCPAIHFVATPDDSAKQSLLGVLRKTGRRVVLDDHIIQIDAAQAGADADSIRAMAASITMGFEVPAA